MGIGYFYNHHMSTIEGAMLRGELVCEQECRYTYQDNFFHYGLASLNDQNRK
jgi:hypothetical protein